MESAENTNETRYDYTLERWITFFLALLFLLPFVAQAAEEPPPAGPLPTTTLAEVADAALLLKTATPGQYAVAPSLSTEVEIRVAGPVVRTRVRQTFVNSTATCVEGVYVFPLPEMSSVDTLKMVLGTRVIAGEIRERDEAARQYQQARSEGRKAALVEQHRPNVFTTSVASLLPGEEAVIEIEYQDTARYENGSYRLRFPMIVAPRYTPPASPQDFLTIASRVIAPQPPNVKLSVDLQPGHGVRSITSSHHRIAQQALGHNRFQLTLDQQDVPTDRDFELVWQPDLGSSPEATVLAEKRGDETYALVLVTPPASSPVRVAREAVFIIDSSGSMEGTSMEQARQALLLALDELRPGDRFNVIDFDSDAHALFPESQPADPALIADAKAFVENLDADGGTEMLNAIHLALPGDVLPGTVRQVIFMTDGQVGNEQELFSYIHENLGDSRLFTVGIGSAPNSHFMRNAARFGRGTFTYIGDVTQVQERMADLFEKLGSPVMTTIDVIVDDPTAEVWPRRVPDLYRGEPLVVAIRLMDASAPVTLRGRIGSELWTKQLVLPAPDSANGIGKLWARQKIEAAMDRLSEGASPAGVRTEVVTTALRHQLVSQYTSLVAVDRTPAAFAAASCQMQLIPAANGVATPQGTLPQTATPAALFLLAGLSLIALGLMVWRLS